MESQTFIVVMIVAAAAFYVGRTLWPVGHTQAGCKSCTHKRNRSDDYA